MGLRLSPRELAYAGAFGAAALVLPVVFHALHLGRAFLPMYLPLMALAFFVRPAVAATTAVLVPLGSALATGMPPMTPPVAPLMALELAAMAAAIGLLRERRPETPAVLLLVPVLVMGRVASAALALVVYRALGLPAAPMAGLALVSVWPGVLLMLLVIPPLVKLAPAPRALPGGRKEVRS